MKKLLIFYVLAGITAIAGYAIADWKGYEFSSASRERIDPSVRKSPGGWRSYSFWHSGTRGGK